MWRFLILLAGPVFLVWGSYALTVGRSVAQTVNAAHDVLNASADFDVRDLRSRVEDGLAALPKFNDRADRQRKLAMACDSRAAELTKHLDASFQIIARPPYVLASDDEESSLDRHYRDTIQPTARALSLMLFDHEPDEPITILLFASERSYQDTARRLDRRSTASYHGYYIRPDRRLMINASTGEGTLSHELTHSLAHFDFPNMPEWFDEGLGSLYEESSFSKDGLRLLGQSNWRLNHLLHAMHHRKLGSLEALLASRSIRSEQQATDYAHARYLCLYLQERELLPLFYRKFRANAAFDPSGVQTLREVFNAPSIDAIDRDFRNWVVDVYERTRKVARK